MAEVLTDLRAERYVDTVFAAGKNRLCVDAALTGTITIGAVAIEDEVTGLTANVREINDLNALIVEDAYTAQKERIVKFGDTVVAAGATGTLVSYTVPAGKEFWFTGYIVGGNRPAEFEIFKGVTQLARMRNSGSQRSREFTFPEWIEGSAGDVFTIKANSIAYVGSETFEATLFGFIKNA